MDFVENLKRYANVRTISIAFPSSIFDNTPTPQLEAYLVGQVARAAVVYNVSEIIIFDEFETAPRDPTRTDRLVKLFEYAECPQYLRKRIFGIEPDLKYAGLIHPLEAQHHLRTSQIECPYREGVTVNHVHLESKKIKDFTEVNIGLNKPVIVPGILDLDTRVTVHVDPHDLKKIQSMLGPALAESPEAAIVPPVEPVEKLNLFWGYYVRKAESITQALKNNVFVPEKKNFYDLVIGTSERGDCIDDVTFKKKTNSTQSTKVEPETKKQKTNDFNHILVVFGGVRGLEFSASCDKEFNSASNITSLFDYYINTCPNQGSTTIRTEEAILITLSALRPKLKL